MNEFIRLLIIIIFIVFLSTMKKNVYEGFEDADTKGDNDSNGEDDSDEGNNCEYRKKTNTGRMCSQKWGEPECNSWKKNKKVMDIEKISTKVLKGYYPNQFMYEIDYDNYGEDNEENDIPRGIHTSFFS